MYTEFHIVVYNSCNACQSSSLHNFKDNALLTPIKFEMHSFNEDFQWVSVFEKPCLEFYFSELIHLKLLINTERLLDHSAVQVLIQGTITHYIASLK